MRSQTSNISGGSNTLERLSVGDSIGTGVLTYRLLLKHGDYPSHLCALQKGRITQRYFHDEKLMITVSSHLAAGTHLDTSTALRQGPLVMAK